MTCVSMCRHATRARWARRRIEQWTCLPACAAPCSLPPPASVLAQPRPSSHRYRQSYLLWALISLRVLIPPWVLTPNANPPTPQDPESYRPSVSPNPTQSRVLIPSIVLIPPWDLVFVLLGDVWALIRKSSSGSNHCCGSEWFFSEPACF